MHSSYSNRRQISNVLRFTPLGFKHPIDVQFPPRCLPVCGRCKKNFKTREHCRGRDCHTDLPWCDTYVCVSLDKSCTDGNGKLLDGPFTAKVIPPVGFTFKEDELDPLTPICAPCKDKNYTRTYCRQNKNHRQLPWSTVYVIVTLDRNLMMSSLSMSSPTSNSRADNNNSKNDSSSPPDIIKMNLSCSSSSSSHKNKRRKKNGDDESSPSKYDMVNQQHPSDPLDGQNITFETATTAESSIEQELHSGTSSTESQEQQQYTEQDGNKAIKNAKEESSTHPTSDDSNNEKGEKDKPSQQQDADFFFSEIPHSRTFLATVSCNTNHLQWVDLDRMLESQVPIFRDNNVPFPQAAYSMNHIPARFHSPPYQGMPRNMPYFVNSMDNSGMVDDARVEEHRGRMLPSSMGQYGMIPYMMGTSTNSPYNNFGYSSHYYGVDGPHPHMMGNNPSMGHFDSMRGMNRIPHMHQNMRGGGPFPFETPSIHNNMDFGGNAGGNGYPSQEMFHHDSMHQQRRPSSSPMEHDARQSAMAGSNSMPFNPMMGGNVHAGNSSTMQSSMDRMNHPASAPNNAGRRRPDMAMTMDQGGDGHMRFMNHPDGGQSFMMRHVDNDNMYYPGNSNMRMQMPMDATRDQFHEYGQTPTNRQPQGCQHPRNQGNHDGVKDE